jgi:hypothetical protein
MQCACVILSSDAYPALQDFSTLSHKRLIFERKKISEHKMCVLVSLQIFSETFLIIGRSKRDIILKKMYIGLYV